MNYKLHFITSVQVFLDEPLGGAPYDIIIFYYNTLDNEWLEVDAEVSVGGVIITITLDRHIRTTSLRLKMTTLKPTWCARVTSLNGCKAPGKLK